MIMQGAYVSQGAHTRGLDADQASNIRTHASRLKERNVTNKSSLAAASEMRRDKYAPAKQSTLTAQRFFNRNQGLARITLEQAPLRKTAIFARS